MKPMAVIEMTEIYRKGEDLVQTKAFSFSVMQASPTKRVRVWCVFFTRRHSL